MFAGVREVRGLPILAAGAPPRFLTNLGIPAEDSRRQAGHRPAFLVFRDSRVSLSPRTRTRLRRLAAKYETAAFVDGDPIRFLHTASGPEIETMAFVAATRAGETSPSTGSAQTRNRSRSYASWTRLPVMCSGTRAKTRTAAPALRISSSMAASSIGKRRHSLRQNSSASS